MVAKKPVAKKPVAKKAATKKSVAKKSVTKKVVVSSRGGAARAKGNKKVSAKKQLVAKKQVAAKKQGAAKKQSKAPQRAPAKKSTQKSTGRPTPLAAAAQPRACAVGAAAPQFSLSDKDGVRHALTPTESPWTVVFFYPKDDTPGCTIEAQEFSTNLAEFARHNVRVFGVSGGDNKSKAKFCAKQQLLVTLLSDTDFSVAQSYGAFGEKKFMGRSYQGIFRKTFVIDARGTIAAIFDEVKPAGHAKEVLEAIAALQAAPQASGPAATAVAHG